MSGAVYHQSKTPFSSSRPTVSPAGGTLERELGERCKLRIIDERAEEETGVAIGAEAPVAQMLLESFGRPRQGYPRGLLPGGKPECMNTAGRRWRGAIIAILLGLGVAMTVAWGWTAAVVYAFFLGVALSYALFAIGWVALRVRVAAGTTSASFGVTAAARADTGGPSAREPSGAPQPLYPCGLPMS